MNVLIIGLGYAGTRYLRAFQSLKAEFPSIDINYAYVGRKKAEEDVKYYPDVNSALMQHHPDIIVVSVSDGQHYAVLKELGCYHGFIVCEKPLLNLNDDLHFIFHALKNSSGFCMDMIERYSEVTNYLKEYIKENSLCLIRASFIWGKDRINDHRSTCGVLSEVIHPLDLIEWIVEDGGSISLGSAIGTGSDFSISGDDVIDSIAITADLGSAAVMGYSSFVNIIRQRTVDFIFSSPEQELIYARLTFDTPEWDIDHVKIWKHTADGDQLIKEFTTNIHDNNPSLKTIRKLQRQVREVIHYVMGYSVLENSFTDLEDSIKLQTLLNEIETSTVRIKPVTYSLKKQRQFFTDDGNLEKLG